MANEIVKIDRGLSTNLPSTNDPGRILITTDTNQMYVDDTAENRIHIQDDTKIPLTGSSAISGNLVPSTTNANNLGSSTNEWNNIYGNIIHGNVVHASTLATNEIEPDTNTKLVISGGTGNEVDIQSNVGIGGNLTIGSSTNTVVITPTTLTLNNTAKTAWQTELGITQGGLTQEQADARYVPLVLTRETTINGSNQILSIGSEDSRLHFIDIYANALNLNGTVNILSTANIGSMTIGESNISGLTNNPTDDSSATSKAYVDSSISTATSGLLSQSTADSRYLRLTGTAASATQLATSHNFSITGGATASAVAFNGTQDVTLNITSLDATKLSGTIPTANLPSYVDDVVEYANLAAFPQTGESGKIYVALDTNLTYRWGGSSYVEISPSLALGTTSDTAFRGDYGQTAYNHANAKGNQYASGFYKIATNNQGHVTGATAVTETDISNLVDSRYLQLSGGTLSGTLNFGDSISIDGTDGLTLDDDMVSQWQSVLAVPTNALTQSSADTRYLQLTGGTVSGSTTFTNGIRVGSSTGPTITNQGSSLVISSNIDMNGNTIQNAIIDGYLTESAADAKYLQLSGGSLTGPLGIQTITGMSTNSSLQISGLGIGFANSQGTNSTLNINRSSADGAITLNMTQGSNQVWITGSNLSFGGSALSNWQEALEIPKFVVSSTQPSDTNVIWLKPVS